MNSVVLKPCDRVGNEKYQTEIISCLITPRLDRVCWSIKPFHFGILPKIHNPVGCLSGRGTVLVADCHYLGYPPEQTRLYKFSGAHFQPQQVPSMWRCPFAFGCAVELWRCRRWKGLLVLEMMRRGGDRKAKLMHASCLDFWGKQVASGVKLMMC